MGREIRRVPPNWEHPRYTEQDANYSSWVGEYRACYDRDYQTAARRWMDEYAAWKPEEHDGEFYWDYDPTPDESTCRPAFTKEPTWYQVYETVSEGTPTTPPFATKAELIEYLVNHGEFQDKDPWPRPAAEQFVDREWAPSAMIDNGVFYTAKTGFPE